MKFGFGLSDFERVSPACPARFSVWYPRTRVWVAQEFARFDYLAEYCEVLERGPTRVRGGFPTHFTRAIAAGPRPVDHSGPILVAFRASAWPGGASMEEAGERLAARGIQNVVYPVGEGREFVIVADLIARVPVAARAACRMLARIAGVAPLAPIGHPRASALPLPAPIHYSREAA